VTAASKEDLVKNKYVWHLSLWEAKRLRETRDSPRVIRTTSSVMRMKRNIYKLVHYAPPRMKNEKLYRVIMLVGYRTHRKRQKNVEK
jgi:hypothetical protein